MLSTSSLLLQTNFIVAFVIRDYNRIPFVTCPTESMQKSSTLFARKGAMSRKKKATGFRNSSEVQTKKENKESISIDEIYSLPALYDLAFGYRNFEEEVDFLLYAHLKYGGFPATNILELAAGPGRHAVEALKMQESCVLRATALDSSPEMVKYGKGIASQELKEDLPSFSYVQADMRNFTFENTFFDSVWILLGSLQHMTTNNDVCSCFKSAHSALKENGTLMLELPHPRETFSMVECTRDEWEVPLEDEIGKEYGKLKIIWGDNGDFFDPITQIRNFTVSLNLESISKSNETEIKGLQSAKEVVPMRQFTAQEIDSIATSCGFEVEAMFGALDEEVHVNDEDEAFRLVCVLRKVDD